MRRPALCFAALASAAAGARVTRYAIRAPSDEASARIAALSAARALPRWEACTPLPEHTATAFAATTASRSLNRPLVLDAGCGTGSSSHLLAAALPDADVVGVDRSAVRLRRGRNALAGAVRAGYLLRKEPILVRADLPHFWRLAWRAGWRADMQFFFYPNPSPLPRHLKRRWHGHPAFPYVVALGGRIEVRASWEGYLREFRTSFLAIAESPHALRRFHDVRASRVHAVPMGVKGVLATPVSNFEMKYLAVGQPVHRLVLDGRSDEERALCPFAEEDARLDWQ